MSQGGPACRDGRSRCFGFVGFKDKQHAADAQKYFDKACMGSCRLQVSFAEPYKGENTATEAAGGDDGSKPEPGNVMDSSAASIKVCVLIRVLNLWYGGWLQSFDSLAPCRPASESSCCKSS